MHNNLPQKYIWFIGKGTGFISKGSWLKTSWKCCFFARGPKGPKGGHSILVVVGLITHALPTNVFFWFNGGLVFDRLGERPRDVCRLRPSRRRLHSPGLGFRRASLLLDSFRWVPCTRANRKNAFWIFSPISFFFRGEVANGCTLLDSSHSNFHSSHSPAKSCPYPFGERSPRRLPEEALPIPPHHRRRKTVRSFLIAMGNVDPQG